ncbi:MAG: hypothetical protein WAT25_18570 [Paracoccaceae bacterium]
MFGRNHPVPPVGAQCRLLSISRSWFHCAPQGETGLNPALKQLIHCPTGLCAANAKSGQAVP